jgi:glycosyltransferase involved in cell wall biosynthesis
MLAIVIPYYKLTFFDATLQSLANQTDKRFHVYIGDDASPENPNNLIEKYKGQFDYVYHRFEQNLGGTLLTKQWERCIALSNKEEWLMILGDDDVLESNCVQAFYSHIKVVEALKINVIRYATVVIDEQGEKISKIHEHPKLEKSTDFLMRKLKGGTRSSLSEFVFRTKVLEEIKFKNLPLAWYSDYLAVLECSNFNDLYTINDALVNFRLSAINITSKNDNLVSKNVAAFQYYYYLLNEKKAFFNEQQTNVLLQQLEKTFLDNKKNRFFWRKYTKLYISNYYFKKYIVFISNMLQSILKK